MSTSADPPTDRVPASAVSPNFPALELDVLDYWDARRHLPRQHRAPRRCPGVRLLRRAAVRQRTAALRPSADRLRQGHRAAVPHDARLQGGAPLRLGHPRAARRTRGRSGSSASPTSRRSKRWASRSSTMPAERRCCGTPNEWRAYVTRQARWVDFDNDYKTLDPSFMESVIWAFKQLWDKGLAYEGYRVLPYCWNDETPLSSHELRMDDDVYQSRQDPAITVGFRVDGGERRARRCVPPDLDDDAVDAAVEPGGRGQPRRRVRRGARRGAALRAGRGAAGGLRPGARGRA